MGKSRKQRSHSKKPIELRLLETLKDICRHHSFVKNVVAEHHSEFQEVALFVFVFNDVNPEMLDALEKDIDKHLNSALIESDSDTSFTVNFSKDWGEPALRFLEYH